MTNSDNGVQVADEVVRSAAKAYDWPVLQPQPKKTVALSAAALQNATVQTLFLHSALDGGIPQRLYADAPLHFFTLTGTSLTFAGPKDGRATSLQVGDATFERLP